MSKVLVKYLNAHPETNSWKITADPRGAFSIPNVGYEVRIPCGTIQIGNHVRDASRVIDPFDIDTTLRTEWPSLAAGQRYQAVLYIEKEGFDPMMAEAEIAKRFDIATLSCKGQSVIAARRLADHVCRIGGGVPLFIVHDFDKSGFEISQCLTTVSERAEKAGLVRYRFQNEIDSTDLGLRLDDVRQYDLAAEDCKFESDFKSDSICTNEEKDFLRSGRRVELNAFTAPQFIEWIEGKLTEHGLGNRLIPDDAVLADHYRRSLAIAKINAEIKGIRKSAIENARVAKIPGDLREMLRKKMEKSPTAWDKALYQIAEVKRKLAFSCRRGLTFFTFWESKKTAMATIHESDVPNGTQRFPQIGHEHPHEYHEFLVECEGPDGPYAPLRGRAVDVRSACASFRKFIEAPADDALVFTVREIVEAV